MADGKSAELVIAPTIIWCLPLDEEGGDYSSARMVYLN